MPRRRVFIAALLALGGIAVITLLSLRARHTTGRASCDDICTLRIGKTTLSVEIANNEEERARGLSGRNDLPKDHGMLFVFPDVGVQTFWMKDTSIPLDIVWIRNRRVVGITAHVLPEPGRSDALLHRYSSPSPVDWVLEIPGTWAAEHGVRIGDRMSFAE